MIPGKIVSAIAEAELPCFVFDGSAIRRRMEAASSLLERYFFPVKACAEPEIVREALAAGAGLDLCSKGDEEIACSAGAPGSLCKLTSAHAEERLLRSLCAAGAILDADSVPQALRWKECGGKVCGLRIKPRIPNALYGAKFGIPAHQAEAAAGELQAAGLQVDGLHFHDQHTNLEPESFALRLAEVFGEVDAKVLRRCSYVNIGGSWPMRHGNPAAIDDLRNALAALRERLGSIGFRGRLYGEPGRWVAGPCGYWAARVVSIKSQPTDVERRIVVLDTNTPMPCRPSLSPFAVLRRGRMLAEARAVTCDIFGSANTALDIIGKDVRLPALELEDVIVALGHGAYTRSLIPPFNERERPAAIVV